MKSLKLLALLLLFTISAHCQTYIFNPGLYVNSTDSINFNPDGTVEINNNPVVNLFDSFSTKYRVYAKGTYEVTEDRIIVTPDTTTIRIVEWQIAAKTTMTDEELEEAKESLMPKVRKRLTMRYDWDQITFRNVFLPRYNGRHTIKIPGGTFEGTFKEGYPEGYGVSISEKTGTARGFWKRGVFFEGDAENYNIDGGFYTGHIQNYKMNGYGKFVIKRPRLNQEICKEGLFVNGVLDGE